jgi:hypothetical protein
MDYLNEPGIPVAGLHEGPKAEYLLNALKQRFSPIDFIYENGIFYAITKSLTIQEQKDIMSFVQSWCDGYCSGDN